MKTVRQLAEEIVAREGGYVNDPDDPGGATNFGVTIGTMRRLGLDLDGDGDVDVADVKLMSAERAAQIFLDHYYRAPKIDRLPESVQPPVFDMYVNSGSAAVKILQRVLQDPYGEAIAVDGVIGPMTIGAAHRADDLDDALPLFYGVARREWYYRLADRRAASRKYARRRDGGKGGWIIRAEDFLPPEYHFTEQEHRNRTASWG